MKFLRKIIIAVIVIVIFSSQLTFPVGISPLAFKNVFQCFNSENMHNNPIFGLIALSSGIIENLRFLNVEAGFDAHGNRSYIKDKAPENDHIMSIIIMLFPSPTGGLTAESDAKTNFGKPCSPKHVSALLNFAHRVRMYLQNNDGKEKKIALFKTNLNKINALLGQSVLNYKQTIDENFDKIFNETDKNKLLIAIATAIFYENQNSFYPKYFVEQIINAFFCLKFADQEALRTMLSELDIFRPSSILESFKKTPSKLVSGVLPFVHLNKINLINGILTQADTQGSLDKANNLKDLTLDDLWIILNTKIFTRIVPYENEKKPISNGSARFYNRNNKTSNNNTFQDCAEVVLRHIINFMLYNATTQSFDFMSLDQHLEGKNNKYIDQIKEFYKIQTSDKANVGDINIRSAWNKVVADLNSNGDLRIKYLRDNNNELAPGMINMMRVFKALFSLELLETPVCAQDNLADLQKWVTDGLVSLFTILNNNYIYEINLSEVKINVKNDDIIGRINIQASDKKLQKLFSFTIKVMNGHAEIDNVSINQIHNAGFTEDSTNHILNLIRSYEAITEFLLPYVYQEALDSLKQSLQEDFTQMRPLYQLFIKTINDSSSISTALEVLSNMIKMKNIEYSIAQRLLKNLLLQFPWEDHVITSRSMLLVKNLKLLAEMFHDFTSVIQEGVKGIALFNDADIELLGFFSKILYLYASVNCSIPILNVSECSQLEGLNLKGTRNLKSLMFTDKMEKLKNIMLCRSGIESLSLPECPQLEGLNLEGTKNLKSLIFTGKMDSLEEIELRGSGIELLSLPECSQLKKLGLSQTKNLKSLIFTGKMDSLQAIELNRSGIESLSLPECSQLKKLNLWETQNLKSLIFTGKMDSLEEIVFLSSGIESISFSECSQLKELGLSQTKNLKSLIFTGKMDSLEEIELRGSGIELLSLPECSQLKKLGLSQTKNLKSLIFTGKMDSLQAIELNRSGIESLSLPECSQLKKLNLMETKNLKSLIFTGKMDSLENIEFSLSGIQKIIGIEFCPKSDLQRRKVCYPQIEFETFQ